MRRLVGVFASSWAVLFAFALLLFGTWDPLTLMGAAAIGFAAAGSATATVHFARLRYAFRARWLSRAAAVPHRTVVDFGILTRELARSLARREPREGVFRTKPFDVGAPTGPVSGGRRAFVGVAAGYSPNAYVVDFDAERQEVLVHDLVPSERSEAPA